MNGGGLFCANFYVKRGPFAPCNNCWCGSCYEPSDLIDFPRQTPVDDDGVDQRLVGDELRFMEARNGDNLITPFQCDLCHFRNILGRGPVRFNFKDAEIMALIRRASLDALWAREPNTVRANLREAVRMEFGFTSRLSLPSVTPAMGPFPLRDHFGMLPAIALLDRSLAKGIHSDHVQWGTFRKARSVVTNITQAGVGGLGDSVGAYERNRTWISNVATHQFWYSRFMHGVHKRVGEVRKPDEIITIDVLHAVDKILEMEWANAKSSEQKRRICEMGAWMMGGFCTGLRGEEMLLVDMLGTLTSVQKLMKVGAPDPHFKFVIIGRTKGVQQDGKKFAIPCVKVTQATGLRPGVWVKRLTDMKLSSGESHGKLFVRKLRPAKLMEFEEDFYTVLERVQETTELMSKEVCVRDACGISRSLRRGVTAHSKNMRIDKELRDAIHRWGKEANTKLGVARLDMGDTCTALESIMPLILEFSRAL
jgi:hypothetical protein